MKKMYPYVLLLLLGGLSYATAFTQTVGFAWARQIDNPNTVVFSLNAEVNKHHAMAVDSQGNVYTTGAFWGTVDFDPGPGVVDLTSGATISSIYITKLNAQGSLVWARCMPVSAGNGSASAITIDKKGSVYITGKLEEASTIDYDPGPATLTGSTTNNNSLFVAKLNSSGNLVWAKQMNGATGGLSVNILNESKSVVVDNDENVYFGGQFNGGIDLDPGPGTANYTIANVCTNCMSVFVAKLTPMGDFVWGGEMVCDAEAGLENMAVDAQANIYMTGNFFGTIDLDPTPGVYGVVSGVTGYIVKLNTHGAFQWARGLQGTGRLWCHGIAADVTGNVFLTGGFYGTVDFNPEEGPANVYNLTSLNPYSSTGIPYYGAFDGYVLKLNTNGGFVWVKQYGAILSGSYINAELDNGRGFSIATDRAGAVYTAGAFIETADFDPGAGVSALTAGAGKVNTYLQKLDAEGNFEWVKNLDNQYQTSTGFDIMPLTVDVDASGNVYTSGTFKNTVDFDPDAGIYNLTAATPASHFILKLASSCALTSSVKRDSACGPYTFNGEVYTASGSYSQPYIGSLGCDSMAILHLVIEGDSIRRVDTGCKQFVLNSQTYTESGIYTQTYTNAAGCDSVLVLDLLINAPDTAVTLAGRTLSARSTEGDYYRWIDCNDNSPVPGATTRQFSPVEDGSYALVITLGGCSDTSACYTIGTSTTIRTVSGNRVKLYPNPVKDMLFIEAAQVLDHASLRLIDIMGKTVLLQQPLQGRSFRVSTANLPPGIYFVELAEGARTSKAKLVKY
ncbi:T9SS type A sorting domain-containing protein [Taibaiella helva]|uniref:T9SS type A sorting domain-containing protein n=1 Tax=Taibaiella helva TaxID=2301235 RepID=UPI000E57F143|nr:T9SS type A sorting domain-containing protein [Taibaiella helva]